MSAFAAILWLVVRPNLIRMVHHSETSESLSQNIVYIVLNMVLMSAFFTHAMGAHAIFGGFLIGLIVPHSHSFAINLVEKLEDLLSLLFLPLYFFFCGQSTQLDLLNDPESWIAITLLVVVGCLSKTIGVALSAKAFTHLPWRESFAMGTLVNSKGLLEFAALYIGHQIHILNTHVYTLCIVAVFLTNFIMMPLIALVYPKSLYAKKGAPTAEDDTTLSKIEYEASCNYNEKMGPKTNNDSKNMAMDIHINSSMSNAFSLVAYIPGMQSVPSLMALTDFLKHGDPTQPLHVTALRLIQLSSDRPSTVMIAQDSEFTLRFDPAMSIYKTFGMLSKVPMKAQLGVSNLEEFPEQIVGMASQVASRMGNSGKTMILLPWIDSVVPSSTGNMDDSTQNNNNESFRNTLTESVKKMLSPSLGISVGVLMDRGFGSANLHLPTSPHFMISGPTKSSSFASSSDTTSTFAPSTISSSNSTIHNHHDHYPQHIFLPFFGGKDDREALTLALRLSTNPSIHITILRLQSPSTHLSRSSTGYFASQTPYLTLSSSPRSSVSNTEDETLLNKLRSLVSPSTSSGGSMAPTIHTATSTISKKNPPSASESQEPITKLINQRRNSTTYKSKNITFEEIHTSAPVSVVIARAHDTLTSGRDLVLMGHLASTNTALRHWMNRELVASILTVSSGAGGCVNVGTGNAGQNMMRTTSGLGLGKELKMMV
jgi:hypothetical protein